MADLRHFRHTFVNHLHTMKLCLDVLDRAQQGAHPAFALEWLASLEKSVDGCIVALDGYFLDQDTILASIGPATDEQLASDDD
jgi:hypothetical protein